MTKKQWIGLITLLALCLAMVGGCAKAPEEELGVIDGVVDQKDPDQKDPTDTTEPDQKEPANTPDNPEPQSPGKEPSDPEDQPDDSTPPAQTPGEEPSDPADPDEEDLPVITKEESGTAITFLMQNLRTSGTQKGTKEERAGGSLNLYHRKYRFKQLVLTHDPDVILAQEGTPGWHDFFATDPYFAKTYESVYIYRKPGDIVDEGPPVLYKKNKYTLVTKGHFWFSTTPKSSTPTYGYTAEDEGSHYRVCSWAQLRDKKTGSAFYAYTIHMDAGNDVVAYKSMEQLLDIFEDLGKDAYAFIGGDFNFGYRDKYYDGAVDFTKEIDLQDMAFNMKQDDLCTVGSANGSLHGKGAYEKEDGSYEEAIFPDPDPGRRRQLDHIFAKLNPRMAVDYWGFDYNVYTDPANGVGEGYISDHYGLVCKVRIDTDVDYSRYQVEYDGTPNAAER